MTQIVIEGGQLDLRRRRRVLAPPVCLPDRRGLPQGAGADLARTCCCSIRGEDDVGGAAGRQERGGARAIRASLEHLLPRCRDGTPYGADEISFFFLDADRLRGDAGGDISTLPRFQDARAAGLLFRSPSASRTAAACTSAVRRGVAPLGGAGRADPDGVQLAVRAFLAERPTIKWLWIDYCRMRKRAPTARRARCTSAPSSTRCSGASLLYLGCTVLLLLDVSFQSRFWTQFEAWLAMQRATVSGLMPTPLKTSSGVRHGIHNAQEEHKRGCSAGASKTVQDAREILAKPDVTVTNQKDKDEQLPKIHMINEQVTKMFAAGLPRGARRALRAQQAGPTGWGEGRVVRNGRWSRPCATPATGCILGSSL